MTANEVAYWSLQETKRANQAAEQELNRSNVAREQETARSNLAREQENARSNLAKETETHRANQAGEFLRRDENQIKSQKNQIDLWTGLGKIAAGMIGDAMKGGILFS